MESKNSLQCSPASAFHIADHLCVIFQDLVVVCFSWFLFFLPLRVQRLVSRRTTGLSYIHVAIQTHRIASCHIHHLYFCLKTADSAHLPYLSISSCRLDIPKTNDCILRNLVFVAPPCLICLFRYQVSWFFLFQICFQNAHQNIEGRNIYRKTSTGTYEATPSFFRTLHRRSLLAVLSLLGDIDSEPHLNFRIFLKESFSLLPLYGRNVWLWLYSPFIHLSHRPN